MANVNIKFNGKDYLLSCDDGQEDNLIELANFLDNKYAVLKPEIPEPIIAIFSFTSTQCFKCRESSISGFF